MANTTINAMGSTMEFGVIRFPLIIYLVSADMGYSPLSDPWFRRDFLIG
jgi:hypothetical protein